MRLMSFSATVEQMRAGTKTVTRRIDRKGYWVRVLEPGSLICAIEKGQGLAKGEHVRRIGVIEIVSVRREGLSKTHYYHGCPVPPNSDHPSEMRWAVEEAAREGFEGLEWRRFVELFCRINRCADDVEVTRIEFRHRPDLSVCCGVKLITLYDLATSHEIVGCQACHKDVKCQ